MFKKRRSPGPDEKYLITGDGREMEVELFSCIDVVNHCDEDVKVTEISRVCTWGTIGPLLVERDPR